MFARKETPNCTGPPICVRSLPDGVLPSTWCPATSHIRRTELSAVTSSVASRQVLRVRLSGVSRKLEPVEPLLHRFVDLFSRTDNAHDGRLVYDIESRCHASDQALVRTLKPGSYNEQAYALGWLGIHTGSVRGRASPRRQGGVSARIRSSI
jgi:hypothetical protein